MNKPKTVWGLAGIWAGAFLMVLAGIQFNAYSVRTSEQKWCKLVVQLDAAYQQTPPTTLAGQNIANAMHQLTIDFGCKEE